MAMYEHIEGSWVETDGEGHILDDTHPIKLARRVQELKAENQQLKQRLDRNTFKSIKDWKYFMDEDERYEREIKELKDEIKELKDEMARIKRRAQLNLRCL